MRGFLTERELVEQFVKSLRQTGAPSGYRLTREFETANGVADVVLFRSAPTKPSTQKLLRSVSPRLVPLLQEGVLPGLFSAEDVLQLSGSSLGSSRGLIRALVRENWARSVGAGRYKLARTFESPVQVIVAVEAKLANWRRALEQARRYREFSNESWVLLDHEFADAALKEAAVFRASNIGLASLTRDRLLYIHVNSPTLPPESRSRHLSAVARLILRQSLAIKR